MAVKRIDFRSVGAGLTAVSSVLMLVLGGGCSASPDVANLDAAYLDCVNGRGVDLKHAQVVVNDDGSIWFVKTEFDVAAEVHGPCLESIGGLPAGLTSSSQGPVRCPPPFVAVGDDDPCR